MPTLGRSDTDMGGRPLASALLDLVIKWMKSDKTFSKFADVARGTSAAIPITRLRVKKRVMRLKFADRLMMLLGYNPAVCKAWADKRLGENEARDKETLQHTIDVLVLCDTSKLRNSTVVLVVGGVFSGICSLRHIRELVTNARTRVLELLEVVTPSDCPVCLEPPAQNKTSQPYACPHVICIDCAAQMHVSGHESCSLCKAPAAGKSDAVKFADAIVELALGDDDKGMAPDLSGLDISPIDMKRRVAVDPKPVEMVVVGSEDLFDEFYE